MAKTSPFKISVNGVVRDLNCDPDRALLDVLREDLRLTGTKRACDIGVCGSCTVLIGGKPKRACVVKIKEVDIRSEQTTLHASRFTLHERNITTIEGISKDGKLHPIQQAFIDCGAIQCGFCTPGMVLSAKALLDENSKPTRDEIKKALANNLCRCTGYRQIFEAVETAAKLVSRSL